MTQHKPNKNIYKSDQKSEQKICLMKIYWRNMSLDREGSIEPFDELKWGEYTLMMELRKESPSKSLYFTKKNFFAP